ncbi:hypothetical protein LOY55_01735 [Pseudomonas sp. B21-040]|uniref:hypothetical protein n=1 Tax=unclassified Pseudomonas TaxID=196821 RepID=UPI001CC0B70B|nr:MULTISPECIES: hypothetical protein [unclassified Pseudomonas]UVL40864.1 hypothetical protein LOY55_01735 [Pseudomonas sp. B21-040]
MSTPSASQIPIEEFKATLKLQSGDFEFKANKINIVKSVDLSGNKCWTIKAFQEIFNDKGPTSDLTGIKEVIAIHLNIAREPIADNQQLLPAALPPALNKNSGSVFKIVDNIPDENNQIDTTENYPGDAGEITYLWDELRTNITGTFSLRGKYADDYFLVFGSFNLLNRGQHII